MDKRLHVTRYVSKYFPPIMDAKNFDYSSFGEKLEIARKIMKAEGRWFEDGQNYDFREATTRNIALGRYQFYVQFADFLFEKYKKRFYLLDYMTRFEDGLRSLLFYIESAERIDINLEGVDQKHLHQATVGLGRLAKHLREIEAPHTTAWEINQVFHKNLVDRTWFHTGRAMTRWVAFRSMGFRVPLRRILNDNKVLLYQFELDNAALSELETED